jgi:hypothetical protein
MSSAAGSDHYVDMARMSALTAIPRYLHIFGDVPIRFIVFALCGHTGAEDVRCSSDDPFWTVRDKDYDCMKPDEMREKARIERCRLNNNATLDVSAKALSIVADGNPEVLAGMREFLARERIDRDTKRRRLLEQNDADQMMCAAHETDAMEDVGNVGGDQEVGEGDVDEEYDMYAALGL